MRSLIISLFAIATSTVAENESCWNNSDECVINANLYFAAKDNGHVILPTTIRCAVANGNDGSMTAITNDQWPLLLRRYENLENISLNGCNAPLNAETFGFEFIPSCGQIMKLSVRRYHADDVPLLSCFSNNSLEILVMEYNEITALNGHNFRNLRKLRELYIVRNFLKQIDTGLFHRDLTNLKLLHIEDEENLSIKESKIFLESNIAVIRLKNVRKMKPKILQQLPEAMQSIEIIGTSIDNIAVVKNPREIRNISIIECALTSFTLIDRQPPTMLTLNLSSNRLTELKINNSTNLQILDLSVNRLNHMPSEWLLGLKSLQQLVLKGNHLKDFPLSFFAETLSPASIAYVDLRDNRLTCISSISEVETQSDLRLLRIRVDRNPWNCVWLLNLSFNQPEHYRLFQYEKFISKINVNGLECEFIAQHNNNNFEYERSDSETGFSSDPQRKVNSSIYKMIYGNARDSKRNQRAEALIIVFMLPLGIALLFLLLYLWIYCQKVFHLSYYRSFPFRSSPERFDIVRVRHLPEQVTSNNNDGYEVPFNGGPNICNWHAIGDGEKFGLSTEPVQREPVKIYQEIVGDTHRSTSAHPLCDKLESEPRQSI